MGTREAALDAQVISLVSDLGDEQLRNIKTDIITFDPRVFNQKIVRTTFVSNIWMEQNANTISLVLALKFAKMQMSLLWLLLHVICV